MTHSSAASNSGLLVDQGEPRQDVDCDSGSFEFDVTPPVASSAEGFASARMTG